MRIAIVTGFFSLMLLLFSCTKDEPGVVHGNIKLHVQIYHHSWTIHHLPVYLKYNATSWPGRDSTLYERSTDTNQDGACTFDELYPGNYYIYAHGYDLVVDTMVIGYMPVQVNSAPDGQVQEVTMYVSE